MAVAEQRAASAAFQRRASRNGRQVDVTKPELLACLAILDEELDAGVARAVSRMARIEPPPGLRRRDVVEMAWSLLAAKGGGQDNG